MQTGNVTVDMKEVSEYQLGTSSDKSESDAESLDELSGDELIDVVHKKLIGLKDKDRLSMLEISMLHNEQGRQGNPFFDVLFDYVDFHAYSAVQEAASSSVEQYEGLASLNIGGIDLTNTFLDFIINRTGGQYELSIRLTRQLASGFSTDRIAELYFTFFIQHSTTSNHSIRGFQPNGK